ncbi:hypothetical protein MTF65_06905 [Streptomyces sp. APSN-46.1]|uniref:hypothetical protein n=1 Tax=Streptomyces sp. APSN-46.1 TaxID=2929049 RepID=UPI001FB3A6CB|nr:hypothetical protein [Streptomyces sp. APSN-46.1]MCJ1677078.1 hypothetical protein [Streptomyces sp. APSN-46.1]
MFNLVRALEVEYESMTGYKKLVDELLDKLDGSEADGKKLAHGTLPAGTLGKGFAEAELLFSAYNTVHSQLKSLSEGLAMQIEALGIAVRTAGKGYAGIDEETKQRMAAIAAKAHEDYVADRDPRTHELAKEQQAKEQQAKEQQANGSADSGAKAKGKV